MYPVADTDLQIRAGLQKFFLALWASVWSKNKGGAPPGPPPGSATGSSTQNAAIIAMGCC